MLGQVLLLSLFRASLQQLIVEVTVQEKVNGSRGVLERYEYPNRFSLEWYVTSYINVPESGVEGVLLYQSIECSSDSLPRFPEDCLGQNFSLILLVENFLGCPDKVIRHAQRGGYSGIITYSSRDRHLDVKDRVYDPTTKSVVELGTIGLAIATVSKEFANILLQEVAVTNCTSDAVKLTTLFLGKMNIEAVRAGMSLLIALGTMLGLLLIFFCLCLLLKWAQRKSGFYDVHATQMQEIEFSSPTEAHERTMYALVAPKLKKYVASEETSNLVCPICLDSFSEGEDVSVLGCKGQHKFHPACISKWLGSQTTCPVCRNHLDTTTRHTASN